MKISLTTSVKELGSVGSKTAKALSRINITTVADLLEHYPFRYQDFSRVSSLNEITIGAEVTVQGTITSISMRNLAKRHLSIIEAWLTDEHESIKVLWFNQPYLTKTLSPGTQVALAGKVSRDIKTGEPVLVSPVYEFLNASFGATHTGRIVPLYPLTEGITQKQLRFLVRQSLEAASELPEFLPEPTRTRNHLLPRSSSIRVLHFPPSEDILETSRRSLQLEELLIIQLSSLRRAKMIKKEVAYACKGNEKIMKSILQHLPFSLTNAQKKSLLEIQNTITLPTPMNRLLQGDVGSGKTVVAALAMAQVALSGHQAVLMAPTELLAQQHYHTLTHLFKDSLEESKFHLALLTANQSLSNQHGPTHKKTLKNLLHDGDVHLAVGTHALLAEDFTFNSLALVVIDEQHRFGVSQRKALREKNSDTSKDPHLLSLTATPIPRTLALTLYGDLELSIIDEKPQGRLPIITKLIASDEGRLKAYQFIHQELRAGRQAFVVCPIIEESDILGVKSATEEFKVLQKGTFKDVSLGLLHGQMKAKQKEEVMRQFKQGEIKVLVATPVVEVGVDVPNATIMMIEGAERFGLAQLHQFRGRVGRDVHQSYCFLMSGSGEGSTVSRLEHVVTHDNGFELAEFDLKTRGAGQIYGTKQSGFLSTLKIADITDHEMVSLARSEAQTLMAGSEDLSLFPELKKRLDTWEHLQHWE